MENPRQLILANQYFLDLDPVFGDSIDVEIGKENSFEVKVRRDELKPGYTYGNILYIPGTEFGGIIGEIETNTDLDTFSMQGYTWRGLLDKKVLSPPSGSDYLVVSGELNTVLSQLISGRFNSYFSVSGENTGVSVTSYQFDRYCTLLAGINKMLKSVGYKLRITYVQREEGDPGYVQLSSVPIVDYSSQIELSQDSKLNFSAKIKRNGINHLVCLGSGELQDRQVIDLYVQQDGSIGTTQYYSGIDEIAQTYDNNSAESAELQEKGTEKLTELMNRDEYSMDVESLGIDVELGDIIGGRDYITGIYVKKPIESKIYRLVDGKESLEYSIEGDE